MAISDYATLKTSIADWLHRPDLTAVIPDFVTLLESQLNRKLFLRLMETDMTLATVVGQSYAAAPTDMIEPLAVYIDWGTGKRELDKRAPETLPYGTYQAAPEYWAVDGANILFPTPIDSTTQYTLTIRYRQKLAISTPTTAATWLLANHPDLYIYGALREASPYILADDRIGVWKSLFEQALREANAKERQAQKVPLNVDVALQPRAGILRENILG